jgi:S-phase kinase-associated protein 1
MAYIKLQSNDSEEVFVVDVETAKLSVTIRTMLDRLGDAGKDEVVPLPNVNAAILRKVIEWCTYHKNHPFVPGNVNVVDKGDLREYVPPWDQKFMEECGHGTVLELVMAAHYLDIPGLQDVACKTVANKIVDKTPEELRKMFNIRNEFNPDEAMPVFNKENE